MLIFLYCTYIYDIKIYVNKLFIVQQNTSTIVNYLNAIQNTLKIITIIIKFYIHIYTQLYMHTHKV